MNKKNSEEIFEKIDHVIRKNLHQRGMHKIKLPGEIQRAAAELLKSSTVFIVTGFCIRDTLTGETDGPIGAIALASALEQLGKKVVLITDNYSKEMLYKCCLIKNVVAPIEIVPYKNEKKFCDQLFNTYRPSHIVAIERPGRAKDGRCYSMRGEDISDVVPNTDILFEKAKELGIITLAVGDGGNEVGMGKVSTFIVDFVKHGEKICAAISTDYLIVAGVSNWGGHALTAALSLLTNTMLLHDIKTEILILKSIIEAGGVDGCSKKRELTVDGLSLKENLKILKKLRTIVEFGIREYKTNKRVI
ncbi:DUF4392 domain-containing protein [Crassaminicella thermophila]|uniref:DUF4392 domain-containing protein n=1 Tax=Crassaminicella thermophila TaxID=2599308 RepID=A0A5C0SIA8_CRATE|nr:DUF4392 domain-containing protein [Crassaminicella thermophila]QEK12938.1 DUF4392 domain-containing protein [Crassaminicella thermophila]